MIKRKEVIRSRVRLILVIILGLLDRSAHRVARVEVPEDELLVADGGNLAEEIVVVSVWGAEPGGGGA